MGYDPTDSYEEVFDVKFADLGNGFKKFADATLMDILNTKGNSVKSFLRHSVAALLNAAHPNVDYAFTVDDVKGYVTDVFDGTEDSEDIKLLFELQNELGGDINS